jgi:hypothetical protein
MRAHHLAFGNKPGKLHNPSIRLAPTTSKSLLHKFKLCALRLMVAAGCVIMERRPTGMRKDDLTARVFQML